MWYSVGDLIHSSSFYHSQSYAHTWTFPESDDPHKCKALMNEGEWYHSHTWLAPGCVSQPYGFDDINSCFHRRRIVLAGDESMQGIYWSIAEAIDGNMHRTGPVGTDLHYSSPNLDLWYVNDPELERESFIKSVEAYRDQTPQSPALIVVGTGRKHAEEAALERFAGAIDRIAGIGNSHESRVSIPQRPLSGKGGIGDLLLFAPVQQPWSDNPETDPKLDSYRQLNRHLKQRSEEGAIDVLWTFPQMTADRRDKLHKDGPAVSDEVSRQQTEVILALRCNAKIAAKGRFPNTRTCCANWRSPNWIQFGFLTMALAILPAIVLLDLAKPILSDTSRPAIRGFSAFTAMIAVQYASDRTHLFEQVKRLDLVDHNLYGMIFVIVLIGLVSIRKSKPLKKPGLGEKPPAQPFLSRDQTNEWKGWMQALIITYHYNKAWKALWFWEVIRLAVSSYLFLTGFGHTLYFLQKQDFSFRRVANVMIRTNLLPVTLAYVMRTRWLLYYYMPLSTFWFLVVYATMAIAPGMNKNKPLLIGKIIASATFVRTFITTKDLPETFVRLFTLVFKMSFDARAFFDYRVKIDEYIVYVGMLAAVLYLWLKDVLHNEQRHSSFTQTFRRAFPYLRTAVVIISALTFAYFWYWAHQNFHKSREWAAWQSLIGPIPVLSFIVLRNATPTLRNYHSAAFAWLGTYSGEMYTMQNHIWLAGDQESVLRTGLFHGDGTLVNDRWRDLVVVTPLYLIACCVIGNATGVIANWFISEDDKPVALPTPQARKKARVASTSTVEMGLLAGENVTADSQEDLSEKESDQLRPGVLQRVRALWPRSVKGRAVLVLASLWFMNWVSSLPSHRPSAYQV
ncbi:hypothetical protein Q7P37_008619 [Cladosporium fusiforme]